MKRLAVIATHPIQYYAPIYQRLSEALGGNVRVFYAGVPDAEKQGEGYGRAFQWDVDLTSGYESTTGAESMGRLRKELADGCFDAVLVHGWHHPFYRDAIRLAWRLGVPVMVRGDSHLRTPRPWWKRALKAPVYRRLLRRFSCCLAVGTWNADYYRHYGVAEERIILSPHCVDNERFERQAAECRPQRLELRRQWQARDDETLFLFVGRLHPMKRVPDFLQALAACRSRCLPVRGLVVGDGPDAARCRQLAVDIQAPVTFAGFLNQSAMVRAYVAADALALPSDARETWGLVVNEALACGLPCLVSDQAGCGPDMIKPGVNGEIFRCGDVVDLIGAMSMYVTGKGKMDPKSEAWRGLVEGHSCEAAARGILAGLELGKDGDDCLEGVEA
ncbi:MAG: glycosyltransferase family 4 protein [Verrucomicrobiae bacterium]|nr:glycosyltransferase family 4 protein [Verrucomicrobiae bacterium]